MDPQATEFLTFDPKEASIQENYKLLVAGVSPRPIALVSTISAHGESNLSPFSFFSAFGANPPVIGFSPTLRGRDGGVKDTLRNLREVPECVVQGVPYRLVQQASLASTEYQHGVDEFLKAGFTHLKSTHVRPDRVAESPFQMECKVLQIIELGQKNASGNLVICEVVAFHVDPKIMENDQIAPEKIDLVGRNSGNYYTRASGTALFEVEKPIGKMGLGIDLLPTWIRTSKRLSGHQLAQIGSVERLPDPSNAKTFVAAFMKNQADSFGSERLAIEEWLTKTPRTNRSEEICNVFEEAIAWALDHGHPQLAINLISALPKGQEQTK